MAENWSDLAMRNLALKREMYQGLANLESAAIGALITAKTITQANIFERVSLGISISLLFLSIILSYLYIFNGIEKNAHAIANEKKDKLIQESSWEWSIMTSFILAVGVLLYSASARLFL